MKTQIVIGEGGWIIEAIAKQWVRRFQVALGDANVQCVYGQPVSGAKVYIHFIYLHAKPVAGARNIVYVTHIDYLIKAFLVLKLALQKVEFVTMSMQTKKLIEDFIPGSNVHCITPTSIHFDREKKTFENRLTFGLFFRLYPDKRKNNKQVKSLIDKVIAAPQGVNLIIYGNGFEEYLQNTGSKKITYDNSQFSRDQYRNYLKKCDYVVYFGMDEGAISILDAAQLSIPVLATRQGYHIDIILPKYSMLLHTAGEVLKAAENLIESISQSETISDPVVLLNQVVVVPEFRLSWIIKTLLVQLKKNPFRASNDWSWSVFWLARSVLRRVILSFRK